jgi:hypothetical protein
VLLTSNGCLRESSSVQESELKGKGIVDRVSYASLHGLPHVNVWPVKGTELQSIVDLRVFEDFTPGLDFEEALVRYGPPATTRKTVNRIEFHTYLRTNAMLAVAKELCSGGFLGDTEMWTVWAFPNDTGFKLESLVASNVLGQLQIPIPPYYLVVRGATPRKEGIWLKVEPSGVTEARWVGPQSHRK